MEDTPPQSSGQFVTPILGADAQSLILCNQKLQELGIDETINLPRIVVIGDQSTGKSSLIEAISQIKVPTASNLCTRCPIAINLTSGKAPHSDWECSVYIEEKYVYNTSVKNKRVSKANPFGPWQMMQGSPTQTLIDTTNDPERLLDLIFAAQNQILNPERKRFDSSDSLEKFSPNVIRIDISVGDCPNLSFVDLPGVIQSAGKDQPEYYVDLVESLARQYARDPNNIIINCLPMNHDTVNSKAYSIIQKESAQSHTIAVFTKADIARQEEIRDCLSTYFAVEAEEEFELGHHIVMLRGPTSPGESSIDIEADFFSCSPWNELPAATKASLGVRNLIDLLRRTLFQKTAETLPQNLDMIRGRIKDVESQLEKMPAPPDTTELPYQLQVLMYSFNSEVKKLFTSAEEQSSLSSRSKLVCSMQAFIAQIQHNSPTMSLWTDAETAKLDRVSELEKVRREGSNSQQSIVIDSDKESETMSQRNSDQGDRRSRKFRLEEIRQLNQARYRSSIPGDIELNAVEHMNCESVKCWDTTFQEFMHRVSKLVNSEVLGCVQTSFKAHKHLPLYDYIKAVTKRYLDVVIQDEWTRLQRLCDAERNYPLTFADSRLRQLERSYLAERRQKRLEVRLTVEQAERKLKHLSGLSKKKSKEPAVDEIDTDDWDVEVQMAAKTRAYYDIASSRFVDTICQNIFAHLIPLCHGQLVDHIQTQLGLNNIAMHRNQIIALMTEDSERESQRKNLLDELTRLNAGHSYIASVLGNGSTSSHHLAQSDSEDAKDVVELGEVDGVAGLPYTSPNKRKFSDTELDTDPSVQLSSPFKRKQQSSPFSPSRTRQNSRYRTHLPARPRSVEPGAK